MFLSSQLILDLWAIGTVQHAEAEIRRMNQALQEGRLGHHRAMAAAEVIGHHSDAARRYLTRRISRVTVPWLLLDLLDLDDLTPARDEADDKRWRALYEQWPTPVEPPEAVPHPQDPPKRNRGPLLPPIAVRVSREEEAWIDQLRRDSIEHAVRRGHLRRG